MAYSNTGFIKGTTYKRGNEISLLSGNVLYNDRNKKSTDNKVVSTKKYYFYQIDESSTKGAYIKVATNAQLSGQIFFIEEKAVKPATKTLTIKSKYNKISPIKTDYNTPIEVTVPSPPSGKSFAYFKDSNGNIVQPYKRGATEAKHKYKYAGLEDEKWRAFFQEETTTINFFNSAGTIIINSVDGDTNWFTSQWDSTTLKVDADLTQNCNFGSFVATCTDEDYVFRGWVQAGKNYQVYDATSSVGNEDSFITKTIQTTDTFKIDFSQSATTHISCIADQFPNNPSEKKYAPKMTGNIQRAKKTITFVPVFTTGSSEAERIFNDYKITENGSSEFNALIFQDCQGLKWITPYETEGDEEGTTYMNKAMIGLGEARLTNSQIEAYSNAYSSVPDPEITILINSRPTLKDAPGIVFSQWVDEDGNSLYNSTKQNYAITLTKQNYSAAVAYPQFKPNKALSFIDQYIEEKKTDYIYSTASFTPNLFTNAVNNVISLIRQIGTVDGIEDATNVWIAKDAYDNLSNAQKEEVTNYFTLNRSIALLWPHLIPEFEKECYVIIPKGKIYNYITDKSSMSASLGEGFLDEDLLNYEVNGDSERASSGTQLNETNFITVRNYLIQARDYFNKICDEGVVDFLSLDKYLYTPKDLKYSIEGTELARWFLVQEYYYFILQRNRLFRRSLLGIKYNSNNEELEQTNVNSQVTIENYNLRYTDYYQSFLKDFYIDTSTGIENEDSNTKSWSASDIQNKILICVENRDLIKEDQDILYSTLTLPSLEEDNTYIEYTRESNETPYRLYSTDDTEPLGIYKDYFYTYESAEMMKNYDYYSSYSDRLDFFIEVQFALLVEKFSINYENYYSESETPSSELLIKIKNEANLILAITSYLNDNLINTYFSNNNYTTSLKNMTSSRKYFKTLLEYFKIDYSGYTF